MNWTVDRTYGCWLFDGDVGSDGYAYLWRGPIRVKAHLIVYEQNVGDVPDGLVLDHTCGNRSCVAPHHLEPVTQRENLLRRRWAYRSRIERCKNGHDMREHAVVIPQSNGRVCRACNREANGGTP